jgi:hypothetical protein
MAHYCVTFLLRLDGFLMNDTPKGVLRLRKKHTGAKSHLSPADGGRLLREQSLPNAIYAGLIVVIVFSILWAMTSTLVDRIFPWMTVVLGMLVGLTVQRAGRGLDWRFPVLAAVITLLGALVSNILVAAAFTAAALETSTVTILRAVTSMTWPVFFDEALSSADAVFALFGAALAAFYANRRLSRAEFLALRKWQLDQDTAD